jgi:hypothetical protein
MVGSGCHDELDILCPNGIKEDLVGEMEEW